MAQSDPTTRSELLDAAIELLIERLPRNWLVETQPAAEDPEAADLIIKAPNASSQALIFVEVKAEVSPRDVDAMVGGPWRRWRRQMGNQPILLVARYLSPRVRDLLAEENVSYVDLTGNTRLSIVLPGGFIETQGASSDPRSNKARAGIRGAKAGAVVRVLVDAEPPYTAAQIARAAGVNEGYLSRILDTLTDDGLVDRESFGPVTRVDWAAMLRRRAEALDLFRPSGTFRYVARQGTTSLLDVLRARQLNERPPTVTGSYAAARWAPVAASALLVIYTMNPRQLEQDLALLPADAGADTVLIRPENDVVFSRSERDLGMAWAAPSQVAIDCLAGSGRMPSEGEALIGWMQHNEDLWRYPSIETLTSEIQKQADVMP